MLSSGKKSHTSDCRKTDHPGQSLCNEEETSRERLKSALYLRLKIVKRVTLWAL